MARGPKPKHTIRLTVEEYKRLQHITRLRKAPYAKVVRAKILLLAYEHPSWDNGKIARKVGCTLSTVRKWRAASQKGPCLEESPRPGAPRFFSLKRKSPNHCTGLHSS